MLNRMIGSIFILIGSAIGAGMLALPLVGASAGFVHSTILLILIWLLMTLTALLILETCLAFEPNHNNFSTMARTTLGRPGQIITWFSFLLLLYATTAAYIDGSSSLIDELFTRIFHIISVPWLNAVGYTVLFGGAVFLGTRTVDYCVRLLLSAKGILLFVTLLILIPHVDINKLRLQTGTLKYVWLAAPIFLNAFGLHFVIPSITTYCERNTKVLTKVIIISTTIPLFVYIIWLLVTFGIIPLAGNLSFTTIHQQHTSVGGLIYTLGMLSYNKYILFFVNSFSDIAMTTSFLGVALGLFDFLADGLNRSNSYFGRFQTALITFLPPLLFVLFYQHGFILALEYSAFFAVILEVFLPAFMVYKLRKSTFLHSPYRVPCNSRLLLFFLSLIGFLLIAIIITDRLHLSI